MDKNWDASERWYTSCVGKEGHYYHKAIVLPNTLRLLGSFRSILDLGCGQGVLARHLPKEVEYVGIDQSKALIESAKKFTKGGTFLIHDVTKTLPLKKDDFERAVFLLSLQNIKDGFKAVQQAAHHLKKGGELFIVLNHPCFRIPRQSGWEFDEKMQLQYRRMNGYLSEQKIPISTNPSQGALSATTVTYHHPLTTYFQWLHTQFTVSMLEEWCSDKKSQGARAKIENRARREFPLFLAIKAIKG